ncbi:MAG: squalene--hopene cyclase [Planctomycetota bacterium]|nr:MAG: squalene--hopene cyclase [Planctomycetota bacterium]
MALDELYPVPKEELEYTVGKAEKFFSLRNFFLIVDKILKCLENNVLKLFQKRALKVAEKWTLDHQLDTGDCAGIFPAMANTVLALYLLGYPLDSEPIQKGLAAIDRFQIMEGNTLRQQSCVSPVWDTAWVIYGLSTCGYTYQHPQVAKAMEWLFANQINIKGDWALKNPNTPPGGWAFQFHNDLNPDTDDTAVVLMALLSDNLKREDKRNEIRRAFYWLLTMQNLDGGWGAFERDNDYRIFNEIPFSESDNLIDPSTEDVTGRVLEAAGQMGMDKNHPQIAAAIEYLKRVQDPRGSWYGRWGVNHIYGTWSVLCGLASVGEDMRAPYVRKAVEWLKSIQNKDGGFGESCRSYVDESWIGKGNSCASQTAWALMALIAAGEADSESAKKAVEYLLSTQKEDGTWDEPEFTGTGFPQFFLIRYHMYRIYFPLLALARYVQALKEKE